MAGLRIERSTRRWIAAVLLSLALHASLLSGWLFRESRRAGDDGRLGEAWRAPPIEAFVVEAAPRRTLHAAPPERSVPPARATRRQTMRPKALARRPVMAPDAASAAITLPADVPAAPVDGAAPLDLTLPRGGDAMAGLPDGNSWGAAERARRQLASPEEDEAPLARDLRRAARPDCRTGHQHLGLLAIGPLLADAVSGEGCRW